MEGRKAGNGSGGSSDPEQNEPGNPQGGASSGRRQGRAARCECKDRVRAPGAFSYRGTSFRTLPEPKRGSVAIQHPGPAVRGMHFRVRKHLCAQGYTARRGKSTTCRESMHQDRNIFATDIDIAGCGWVLASIILCKIDLSAKSLLPGTLHGWADGSPTEVRHPKFRKTTRFPAGRGQSSRPASARRSYRLWTRWHKVCRLPPRGYPRLPHPSTGPRAAPDLRRQFPSPAVWRG